MKEAIYDGEVYKPGDWVVLTKTPHGGYEIGDKYQILELTGGTEFTAMHKSENRVQEGFGLSCHRKATDEEVNGIINLYTIF